MRALVWSSMNLYSRLHWTIYSCGWLCCQWPCIFIWEAIWGGCHVVELLEDSKECSRMPVATETLRDSMPGTSSLPAGMVRSVWHVESSSLESPSPSPPISSNVGLVILKSEHLVMGICDTSASCPTVPTTCQPCSIFSFNISARFSYPYTPITSIMPELALLTTGDSGQV